MSSTSRKHRNFVSESMGRKQVTRLPGVGEALGTRLSSAGYGEAQDVLGQFLVVKRDPERFHGWMKNTCSANTKQSSDCYRSLDDWCDQFL